MIPPKAQAEQYAYEHFLESKTIIHPASGIDIPVEKINPKLFPFQRDITRWALRKGRAAIFADCGMGKTAMELEWARHIPGRTIIFAPLAVSSQTVREGEKFSVTVVYSRQGIEEHRTVTNYEMLKNFKPEDYQAVVLDESSIIKSFDAKFRNLIVNEYQHTPFKLAATATPAPNDIMEIGNHSEFLGNLTRTEMLSTFFVHDGGDTSKWRLKGHAEKEFWKWVSSWAVMLRMPSDLGYEDGDFVLPELKIHNIVVDCDSKSVVEDDRTGQWSMFPKDAKTLSERRSVRSETIQERVAEVAKLVKERPVDNWLIWCNLNKESEEMTAALELLNDIPRVIEVTGSDSPEHKDKAMLWFAGEKCICHDPVFSSKISTWRTILNITNGIIESTEKKGSKRLKGGKKRTAKKESLTAKSTTETTGVNGEELSNSNARSTLQNVEDTPKTKNTERNVKHSLHDGKNEIQKKSVNKECENMVSLRQDMTAYSHPKMGNVQYAEAQGMEIEEAADSILTTATIQASSEDYSAPNAILGSENSSTAQNFLKEQQCICGHISGARILVSKSSICGFGLNFQACHNVVFLGLSDSFESYYQSIRRCWRFGQKSQVSCYIVTSSLEGEVVKNIQRKEADARKMAEEMVNNMHELNQTEIKGQVREEVEYETACESGDRWNMMLGDNCELIKNWKESTVHYIISSWPFASLYTYSATSRDVGNCRTHAEFWKHMEFLIPELYRVLMPGRLMSIHLMNLPTSKERDGVIGITDFRGDAIRACQKAGFIYHSEVCIWKDPVTAMQRTKALGLLHKQLKKDSCMSRQGIPDYLVTLRKPGENPERVSHTNESFPVSIWQNYASPVWMDIRPSDTLQKESAREDEDERHICPLQLEVIQRGLELWTNPNDIVLDPFMGIGSVGYQAVKMGRRAIGVELKKSYFKQACANLKAAEQLQGGLFSDAIGFTAEDQTEPSAENETPQEIVE